MFPVPPLAEQHRIVDKIESFMKLIDQLENNLKIKADLLAKMAEL